MPCQRYLQPGTARSCAPQGGRHARRSMKRCPERERPRPSHAWQRPQLWRTGAARPRRSCSAGPCETAEVVWLSAGRCVPSRSGLRRRVNAIQSIVSANIRALAATMHVRCSTRAGSPERAVARQHAKHSEQLVRKLAIRALAHSASCRARQSAPASQCGDLAAVCDRRLRPASQKGHGERLHPPAGGLPAGLHIALPAVTSRKSFSLFSAHCLVTRSRLQS